MRALIFLYIIEKVAHAHAQNAPLEWFSVNTWARNSAEAVDWYPVINICDIDDNI